MRGLGWQKDLHQNELLPTLLVPMLGGVMVLAAQIVRVLARFGLKSRFSPRLKVCWILSDFWLNPRNAAAFNLYATENEPRALKRTIRPL
jgi:hypothetical protein